MGIAEQIYLERGVMLPIRGGYGSRIDNCVIIDKGKHDFITIQNKYLDCIWGKFNWTKIAQSLIEDNDKMIDLVVISVAGERHEFFFDIGDSMG